MSAASPSPSLPTAPEREPTALAAAPPFWPLGVLLLALVVWAGAYLQRNTASFHRLVYEPYTSVAQVASLQPKSDGDPRYVQGRRDFQIYCGVCHQASGLGVPGQFPPLAGSEWVLAEGPNRMIRIVLNSVKGDIEVAGQVFNNPGMPPWRDVLTDDQIAGVLTYIRQSKDWGHKGPAVTPDQVKAIRDQTAGREDQWTVEELLQVPPKD